MPAAADEPEALSASGAIVARKIVEASTNLRETGLRDPLDLLAGRYADAKPGALDLSLPDAGQRDLRTLWSFFFSYSQVFIGLAEGKQPIAGFFNPLADYWLFTVWDIESDRARPVLSASWLLPGQFLIALESAGAEPLRIPTPWVKAASAAAFGTTLGLFGSEGREAFQAVYPLGAANPTVPIAIAADAQVLRRVLRDRLASFVSDTVTLLASAHLRFAYETTLSALAVGDERTLYGQMGDLEPPVPVEAIVALPREYRTALSPAAFFAVDRERIILSGSVYDGSWFLVTHYQDIEGQALLKAISYVDVFPELERSLPEADQAPSNEGAGDQARDRSGEPKGGD